MCVSVICVCFYMHEGGWDVSVSVVCVCVYKCVGGDVSVRACVCVCVCLCVLDWVGGSTGTTLISHM